MVRKNLRTLRNLHMITDAFLLSCGWLGAYVIRFLLSEPIGFPLNPFPSYIQILPLIVFTWLASCWFFGIYKNQRHQAGIERTQNLLKSTFLGWLLTSSIAFYFKEYHLGRTVVLLSGIMNLFLLSWSWYFFHRWTVRLNQDGAERVRALILGANTNGIRLLQKLMEHPDINYKVVGFLDPDASLAGTTCSQREVLGTLELLRDTITRYEVDEVFVGLPTLNHRQIFPMVLECEDLEVGFWILTNDFEALNRERSDLPHIEEIPLNYLGLQQVSVAYPWVKRAFDFAASLSLLLFLAPFCLWWCLRIKLDSPGPIFFSQTRVGHYGQPFTMYKFRTMHCDVAPYEVSPQDGTDQRITTYGKWLRRTSIDEIPQLLNVLKGEMSLVGPRPEMPFIVETYEAWQHCRLRVKPGLTGLWQILGRKDLPMHENLQYDFYYIRNRSLLLDLSILFRTIGAVFRGKGAY